MSNIDTQLNTGTKVAGYLAKYVAKAPTRYSGVATGAFSHALARVFTE